MSQDTLQAKLAYLVARTNLVKKLAPIQRLLHVEELVALQLDLFAAIIERIDDVSPPKVWCQRCEAHVVPIDRYGDSFCPHCELVL